MTAQISANDVRPSIQPAVSLVNRDIYYLPLNLRKQRQLFIAQLFLRGPIR